MRLVDAATNLSVTKAGSIVGGIRYEGAPLAECDLRSHQREEAESAFVPFARLERPAREHTRGLDGGPNVLQMGAELNLDPYPGTGRLLVAVGLEPTHQMDAAVPAGSGAGVCRARSSTSSNQRGRAYSGRGSAWPAT